MPYVVFLVLCAFVVLAGFAGWALGRRRSRSGPTQASGPDPLSPAALDTLGALDGKAGLPNDLTRVPFPTPAMDEIYEEGERRRAEQTSLHLQRTRSLRVKEQVIARRTDQLAKLVANAFSATDAAETTREASLVEQSLAATRAALATAEQDHAARLEALDAATFGQLNRYWGANLRSRDRSAADTNTDLDGLVLAEPALWRAQHAMRMAARTAVRHEGEDLA